MPPINPLNALTQQRYAPPPNTVDGKLLEMRLYNLQKNWRQSSIAERFLIEAMISDVREQMQRANSSTPLALI